MPSLRLVTTAASISLLLLSSCLSPKISYANRPAKTADAAPTWNAALQAAMEELSAQEGVYTKHSYSTSKKAHDALRHCFAFTKSHQLYYFPERLTLSYCSGAVHTAVLAALIDWARARPDDITLRRDDWENLVPRSVRDGDRVWGWANSNGAGYAVLVHELGAGYSFTEWEKARPLDIVKLWWTKEIGRLERGHLAVLLAVRSDDILIWGAHARDKTGRGGIYVQSIPKEKIQRALFTRITNPEAFEDASHIDYNPWLNSLLRVRVSWEETLRRSGVRR